MNILKNNKQKTHTMHLNLTTVGWKECLAEGFMKTAFSQAPTKQTPSKTLYMFFWTRLQNVKQLCFAKAWHSFYFNTNTAACQHDKAQTWREMGGFNESSPYLTAEVRLLFQGIPLSRQLCKERKEIRKAMIMRVSDEKTAQTHMIRWWAKDQIPWGVLTK